ncbi:MAG TPA: DNA repair protein RecO [Candidatus Anaerobutyricum stercoripullorum]|uniref:DNA repair protein RecO n=1 Tax=Candidatus Anaerobutyricum stercoripullorum TaxID=2838456 RepID=A0A9D2BDR1_9FIRM|nr:DNA repair protein RecO [Candidatus Anaerobutyricum stercoripullorum]
MSEQIKVTGIVLSVYPIGENDRRLTILTKERGKIQVFARGCRKPNHPLFGVTQPLIYCEFMITEGRQFNYLNSAEGRNYFPHLKEDLEDIYYSTYFAELAEYFTVEGLDERNILNLLFVTFVAMEKKKVPLPLIRRIYELKILQYYGIGMEVFRCISCGKTEGLDTLSFEAGGVLCHACAQGGGQQSGSNAAYEGGYAPGGGDSSAGGAYSSTHLDPAVLYALQYVLSIPLQRLYSFVLKEEVFLEFQWIVKHFFRIHVEHWFKAGEMLEEL